MSLELTGLRVFIATPSMLNPERSLFRETLVAFNEDHAFDMGFVFIPIGWELVPGGVGRPQELINEEVRNSDFLVLILFDRWGTPTSPDSEFTSGTHEEFSVALECLSIADQPMRDILILFKAIDASGMADPGEQLKEVLQFRQQIEGGAQLLYHVFDKSDEMKRYLERRLKKWADNFGEKAPIVIEAPDLVAELPKSEGSADELVARARQLESDGLTTQAEANYASAFVTGDPSAMAEYARFLRRTGRLARAFDVNQEILSMDQVIAADDSESLEFRSTIISNMGVIRRKQGDLRDAERLLREGLQTALAAGELADSARAYAIDNLALTLRRRGRLEEARTLYEEALEIRTQNDDLDGEAKSLVNLARLAREEGDFKTAISSTNRAIERFRETGDQRSLANALANLGETYVAQDMLAEAEASLGESLQLNETLGGSDGIAVSTGQLAKLKLRQSDTNQALDFALRCLDVNQRSSNKEGTAIAHRLVGSVLAARGDHLEAIDHFRESAEMLGRQRSVAGEALSLLNLGEALIESGRTGEARSNLEKAIDVAARANRQAVADRARDLIAALGGETNEPEN